MTTALASGGLAATLAVASPAGAQPAASPRLLLRLFHTSDRCTACHNGLVGPAGEDLSIGSDWRGSMMANSARDPYWQAAVRREVLEHPQAQAAIEDKCSTCHMPMARTTVATAGGVGAVFAHLAPGAGATELGRLAADGVSCALCHQIGPERLGEEESLDGGYVVDTARRWGERRIFGPYQVDPGRTRIMHSATELVPTEASHLQGSELCATCHTLYTQALGPDGEVVGVLPEQVPYQEWLHSAYRETASCQSCHLPVVEADVPISAVLGEPRSGFSRHQFRGGNFLVIRMLNRYRAELGVVALPQELEAAAQRTVEHLQSRSARLEIERAAIAGGRLEIIVRIENLAGHKLPTAYPSRRAWIHLTVSDGGGATLFESGAFDSSGRIRGNDNDEDGSRFEPHHLEITTADQVQIYEAIMVDHQGEVTTGLLSGVRFAKDNRVLPNGFDKATAGDDIAVRGGAHQDADFGEGADRIRYRVDLGDAAGPFRVGAELWYQPIAWRWARNLRVHRAAEIERFARYYDDMAASSALALSAAAAVVE
jgi:hypothetical protein